MFFKVQTWIVYRKMPMPLLVVHLTHLSMQQVLKGNRKTLFRQCSNSAYVVFFWSGTIYTCSRKLKLLQVIYESFDCDLIMGGSPGKLSEELVTQEKRQKGWRMNCDVGEATEGFESSFSNLSVTSPTSQLILQPFCRFTYVTAHSPTLSLLYLRHSSFSNPSFAYPALQALHLIYPARRPWN